MIENQNLVYHVARKNFRVKASDFDDLISEGNRGLIHAAKRFDPSLGLKFSTFASKCVWGYMLTYYNRLRGKINQVQRDLHVLETDAFGHLDTPRDHYDASLSNEVTSEIIDEKIEKLKAYMTKIYGERLTRILTLKFIDRMTMRDIAKREGVSAQRLHQLMRKKELQYGDAFEKMKTFVLQV